MSIYQKLQTIRVALQEEQIKKTGHNKFSDYDYYELKDFLPAINRHCLTHKITPIINFSDENYVTLTLYDFEKPDEKIVFYSPKTDAVVKGAQSIQNLGATETYQRRYLYLMAFEIAESDTVECTQGKESKSNKSDDKSNVLQEISRNATKFGISKEHLSGIVQWKFKKENATKLTEYEKKSMLINLVDLNEQYLKYLDDNKDNDAELDAALDESQGNKAV